MIGIYRISHTASGRVYIGQSCDVKRRWAEHRGSTDQSAISRAIRKYGKQAFIFELIRECRLDQLDELETWYITHEHTLAPNGFNLNAGGDGRREISEETRAKLSLAQTEIQSDPEQRLRQSVSNKETWSDPELLAAHSNRARAQWGDQQIRARRIEANNRPEVKRRKSAASKSRWAFDTEYRNKMLLVLENNRRKA